MGSKVDYAGYYLFVLVLRIPIEIVASPGCGDVGMPHLRCDQPVVHMVAQKNACIGFADLMRATLWQDDNCGQDLLL